MDTARGRLMRLAASDPSMSEWLKGSLLGAMKRDPVDAANEAAWLAEQLGLVADEALDDAERGRA